VWSESPLVAYAPAYTLTHMAAPRLGNWVCAQSKPVSVDPLVFCLSVYCAKCLSVLHANLPGRLFGYQSTVLAGFITVNNS
jgi:hypothetical protein